MKKGTVLSAYQDVVPSARENYTFAAWSPDANVSVSAFRDRNGNLTEGVTVFDWSGTMPESAVKVYPIWIHDRLNVHLDLGAVDADNRESWYDASKYDAATPAEMDASQGRDFTVDLNESIRMTSLDAATRAGYALDGWYTSGGVKWKGDWGVTPEYCDKNADGSPVIQKNETRAYNYYTVTLTARWTPTAVSVKYVGEGTALPTDSGSYALGDEITIGAAPAAPEGKTFTGWTDAQGALHSPGEQFLFSDWTVQSEETITFTASYIDTPEYAITFDSKGGTAVAPITDYVGEPVEAPADPTKTGYAFAGWFDGDDPVTFPLTLNEEGGKTLTARWTVNTYAITFESKGGSAVNPLKLEYGAAVAAPANPAREHYAFDGWTSALPMSLT